MTSQDNQKRKRILIFIDWFTPAHKAGGPIRSIENLALLLKHEYNLFIFTSTYDLNEKNKLNHITADTWVEYDDNVHVFYSSIKNISFSTIRKVLLRLDPQFIYLCSMFSRNYTLKPLITFFLYTPTKSKIILSPRGMLHEGAINIKPLRKKLFLHLFRLFGFPKKIHFHATDKTEYENIQLKLKTKQISLVENIPIQTRHSFVSNKKLENELTLVFVSRISKEKNLHFLLKILKTRSFHGDIKLDIYGPKENDYWNVCRQHLDDLPENIKIAYKGVLEHRDVLPNIRKYHFFVLPTLGENFGHAIFESFVSGRPVIISDQTPWRNLLKGKIGWDLSLKNEEIWADTINRALSMGQHEFNDWCKSAYSFASRYQKKNTLAQYKNLFS